MKTVAVTIFQKKKMFQFMTLQPGGLFAVGTTPPVGGALNYLIFGKGPIVTIFQKENVVHDAIDACGFFQ